MKRQLDRLVLQGVRVRFYCVLLCLAVITLIFAANAFSADMFSKRYLPVADKADAAEIKPDQVAWPHDISDIKPDPEVHFGELSNRFRFLLMKNQVPKDRVSMHLVIQAGSIHEARNQRGLAHFLEHMLFNGTTHFKPGELVKYFQSIGMQFGPDANAHTGFSETVYDVLLPSGDLESLADAMRVMKDYAQGALLLPSEIDRESRVILAEKRSRDSADYRVFRETLQFEFPDTLLPHRLPIGEEQVIKTANRKVLKSYYDSWYRPNNMILVLVGDFKLETAGSLIDENFSTLKSRSPEPAQPDIGKINHHGIKAFYHHEAELGASEVSIEVLDIVDHQPDTVSFQIDELKIQMANRMVQNRLEKMISKPDIPFTSAGIHAGYFLQRIKYAEISAGCSPNNWRETLTYLEQTLRQALRFGFTTRELSRVKKELLSELDNAVKQADTRKSGVISRQMIRLVNNNRVVRSPAQEQSLLAPIVERLTAAEIHAALRAAWQLDHRLILVTGNAPVPTGNVPVSQMNATGEQSILSVYNKSLQVQVDKPVDNALVRFPYLPKPEQSGRIARQDELTDLGVTRIEFENGVLLNLKKTDFQAGKVNAAVVFGWGKSAEPASQPGLAELCGSLLNGSGVGNLDKNELSDALAGTDTTAWFSINEDHFEFRGSSPTENLRLLIQLLHTHITDPAYRQNAYLLAKERLEQWYLSLSREIEGALKITGNRFLAGGDSRFGLPSLDSLQSYSLRDIEFWIGSALKQESLEISIVGDFDMQEAILSAATYFGSLPVRIESPKTLRPSSPKVPEGRTLDIRVDTQIQKGMVVIGYPTADYSHIGRVRRLSVLSAVFSDRLRRKIREELGASYSPFAFNRSSRIYPGYGVFQSIIFVTPGDENAVIDAVKNIAFEIVKNGITEDERQRSIKPILTNIKDLRRTNAYWLNRVLVGSKRHPKQLDWSRSIESDYGAISREEIMTLARKYLKNEKATQIIVLPKSKSGT
ncbi:MAG: insulinase family protein [Deltaproteobacteria bacterium]|nr:insulinase family protein [Deltaproteobacteria bacterium]